MEPAADVLTAADRAALETALQLRDTAPDRVIIEVIAVGPARLGQALRELHFLGVSRVHLILSDVEAPPVDCVAAAVVHALQGTAFDTVVWGAGLHEEGIAGSLVAAALGAPRRLSVAAGLTLRSFTTTDALAASGRRVDVIPASIAALRGENKAAPGKA